MSQYDRTAPIIHPSSRVQSPRDYSTTSTSPRPGIIPTITSTQRPERFQAIGTAYDVPRGQRSSRYPSSYIGGLGRDYDAELRHTGHATRNASIAVNSTSSTASGGRSGEGRAFSGFDFSDLPSRAHAAGRTMRPTLRRAPPATARCLRSACSRPMRTSVPCSPLRSRLTTRTTAPRSRTSARPARKGCEGMMCDRTVHAYTGDNRCHSWREGLRTMSDLRA
jgi:hypothetical protein